MQSQKEIPTKLLQMIKGPEFDDDLHSSSDNLQDIIFVLQIQDQEFDASINPDPSYNSSDKEELVFPFQK